IEGEAYALDGRAADAQRIALHGDVISDRAQGRTARITFRTRNRNFPLQNREALIVGETVHSERPAAWKAILIRPQWEELKQIEIDLLALRDSAARIQYLVSEKIIGVLYSRSEHVREKLALQTGNSAENIGKIMQERRASFRALVRGDSMKDFELTPEDI